MKFFVFIIALFLVVSMANAQYATRKVSKKQQAYTDSLKQVEYDYIFPFLGQKTYKAGFDIPYPIGIMGNFMWMDQGILIDNMQLGIKTDNQDIPLTPVDFITFGDNSNTAYTVNVRPDIWIFPFLNVYGIFGTGRSKTTVRLVEPVPLTSIVEQNVTTSGVGVMGAFGLGPLWVSVDANWTWNKPELLDKAVQVRVMGIRVGHTFKFEQHPERNIAIWAGAMRVKMESETRGQITMSDALPQEVLDAPGEFVDRYDEWYDDQLPIIQDRVDNSAIPDIVDRIGAADFSSTIRYGMDKQVLQRWNGVFGVQFQANKRWQFRTEWGLIGDRKSALASVNYRFLL